MRRRRNVVLPAFCQVLRDAGWLLKTAPMPTLVALGFDEYVYVDRARKVHLHISAGKVDWEAKQYSREPFGDYTTVYQLLGKGVGVDSLRAFLIARGNA